MLTSPGFFSKAANLSVLFLALSLVCIKETTKTEMASRESIKRTMVPQGSTKKKSGPQGQLKGKSRPRCQGQ